MAHTETAAFSEKDQLEKNNPLCSQSWLTECILQDICSHSSAVPCHPSL